MFCEIAATALGSALIHLWAEHRGHRALVYACKPLTTARPGPPHHGLISKPGMSSA